MTTHEQRAIRIHRLLNEVAAEPGAETDEMLDAIQDFHLIIKAARFNLRAAILVAYDEGCTDQEIADAMGVARQDVQRMRTSERSQADQAEALRRDRARTAAKRKR